MAELVKSTWLIKRNGNINTEVDKNLNLVAEDSPVAVVSIIGGQSTGKSTILNHLFGTRFEEMDADLGRSQTTKGIWVAKKPLSPQGCLLVVDTEGSDGVEQEDDTTFEKQTALFALAVSDTIIINMWCAEVGRNKAAGWPLLKIVFEVLMRLCDLHMVNLLFILRDKTKIWEELAKPQDKRNAKLEDYFQVKVEAMSHYESEEEKFKLEVAELKDKIISNSTAVESNNKRIAASGFAGYAKRIWDLIKEDKDLDLPRERIMISEVRCNQIANENNKIFCKNESWLQVKKDIYTKATGFGEKVNSLIENCLSQYDEKALYFDETIRAERRERLIEDLLKVVEPIYRSLIERISHENMQSFKKSVDLEKEYMKKGKDLLEAIQDYVPDFLFKLDKQFADACIERANWDHATTLRQKKEDEAKAYVEARLLHFLKSIQDNNSEVGMTMKDLFIKAGTVGLDAFSVVFKALDHSLSSKISSSKAAMTPPETSSFPSPQKVAFHKIGVSPQTSLSPEQVLEVTKRVQAMSSLLSNKI